MLNKINLQLDMEFWKYILPGLIAIVGNIIFYTIIKGRIDKSIEKHKIAYSGVFKEKIDIYRELLIKIYDLKFKIQQYQYFDNRDFFAEIKEDFKQFIRFCFINKPFLSQIILENSENLTKELQECFEDFHRDNSLIGKSGMSADKIANLSQKFFESGNKFKTDTPFKSLENIIISEMRRDLNPEK